MESISRLILIPSIITFGVTLLRLIGELNQWSPTFFSREAGGGGAIVGITWLVPVFGIYFALKLSRSDSAKLRAGKTLLYALAGLAAFVLISFGGVSLLGLDPNTPSISSLAVFVVGSIVAAVIAYIGAPGLARVLLGYGLAARIPVVIVMLVAMLGNWGTHYDVAPPDFPEMGVFFKWVTIGVVPQLTFWLAFTLILGGLVGGLTLAVARRKPPVPAA